MLRHVKFVAFLRATLALLISLALGVALSQSASQSAQLGWATSNLVTKQLVWPLDANYGFLNGFRVQFQYPSRTIDGRSVLPLRELSRVLGIPLETVPGVSDGIRFGRLELYPSLKLARLDGKQVALTEVATILENTMFVTARSLDAAINANVQFDTIQRLITLTIARDKGVDSTLPVARFATDKREYRLGEPVQIVKYSYDPNGVPITFEKFTGREEAYFSPGIKTISLQVTNKNGLVSTPFTQQIRVSSDVMFSLKDYGLRFTPVGRTIADRDVLSYPLPQIIREDEPTPLLLSDSPEEPDRSGLLYEDVVNGPARLIAYHSNGSSLPGRVMIWAANLETTPVQVRVSKFGETSATTVVATLGRASLLDFLTSGGRESLNLDAAKAAPLYLSQALDPGEGLNLMFDLETTGRVQLVSYFIEENLIQPVLNDLAGNLMLETLRSLPILDRDGVHQRGTFYGAVRKIRIDLNQVGFGAATRLVVGDGVADPFVVGQDVLTGDQMVLKGNYGITYRITLENTRGTVGAIVPRGGPYAGAMKVNGAYVAVPDSGTLFRNDLPAVFYRALDNTNRVELELIPASGSYLPINLVFYRVSGIPVAAR
jgi:hypothetical protein